MSQQTRDAWTQAVKRLQMPKAAQSKYKSVKTTVDGITFDSKRESQRYHELKLMQRAGQISGLMLQPAFQLYVKPTEAIRETHVLGIRVGEYTADFKYTEGGVDVIEDVKSPATRTQVYRLRKRMVEAQYGITVREV